MNQLNDGELSGPHRKTLSLLRERNIVVVSEYPITLGGKQYKLDCFLPDYLVAVEIDGPYHSRKRDLERDAALNRIGIPTLRIPISDCMDGYILVHLRTAEDSLQERRKKWAKRKEYE
jgi:hypothetical protein